MAALAAPRPVGAAVSDRDTFRAAAEGNWLPVSSSGAALQSATGAVGWEIREGRLFVTWPTSTGRVARVARFRIRDAREGGSRAIELQPEFAAQGERLRLTQQLADWNITVEAILSPRDAALDAAVRVRSGAGEDIPLRVEFALDAPGADWQWWDDARHARPIANRAEFANLTRVLAGYDGQMSRYPLALLTSQREAMALAVPMLRPRVFQMVYDGATSEYRLAVDFALSRAAKKFPNEATFFFSMFAPDPALGFRGAFERYMQLYPDAFVKRVEREGVWMPFTRINDVRDAQDFHFGFHEYGAVDLAYNRRHGINSFLYVEPWTYWMNMESGVPRETAVALALLAKNAKEGDAWNRSMAQATLISAVHEANGEVAHQFVDQPWSSGTLFFNNSDPDIATDGRDGMSAGRLNLDIARREVVEGERTIMPGWDAYADGYRVDGGEPLAEGMKSLMLDRAAGSGDRGAVQTIVLDQDVATPIWISGYSRAEDVAPGAAMNYSIYADVALQDGSNSWGHTVGFDSGTHDWQQREMVIALDAPIKSIKLHVLLRGERTGRAWFADLQLKEISSDLAARLPSSHGAQSELAALPNRVQGGDFASAPIELRADGMYLDSMEGWANRLNFRADHFLAVDTPLAYETGSGRTAIFNLFSIFEFTQAMADYLHANDRLLMGNWVLIDFPFLGALLDVPGKEVHWLDSNNAFAPDDDATMLYRRTLSGHKPYPLLLNVRFEHFTSEMMRKFFERSLFYGFYPSMFSHDASSNPYFENPALYERDRDLFLRFIPLVREVSAAGWEPVTRATSSNPKILIERYGRTPSNGLYFTLHHDGDGWGHARVAIDAESLGLTGAVRLVDVTDGAVISARQADGALVFDTRLGDYGTRMIRVLDDTPDALVAFAKEQLATIRGTVARHEEQQKISVERAEELRAVLDSVLAELDTAEIGDALQALRRVQKLRGAEEAQKNKDFARAVDAAENAVSDVVAKRIGLSFSIEGPGVLVSPTDSRCVIDLANASERALGIESVELAFVPEESAQVRAGERGSEVLAAGERARRELAFSVPANRDAASECAMRVVVNGVVPKREAASNTFSLARTIRVRVVSGFGLHVAPLRILTVRPEAEWSVALANHQDRDADVELRARADGPERAALSWTQQMVRVEAGGSREVSLRVETPSPVRRADYSIVISAGASGAVWGSATGTLVRFPASQNLLLDTNVDVRVDSTFAGYSIKFLRDGIHDVAGLDWSESAWASADMAVPHWIEARWTNAQSISEVTIYWAEDGSAYFRSRDYKLQYRRDGEWVEWPASQREESSGADVYRAIEPLATDGLRLWQEAGGGSSGRPNLLWLRELDVR